MPGVIGRGAVRRSKRTSNKESNRPQPQTPIYIASATAVGSVLTLTFDQVVILDGLPGFTTNLPSPTPVSAEQTAPNIVAITFSAAIATADSINIPFREPAIRNSSGGFVTANTFPVA